MTVLLLAGTSEAAEIAAGLVAADVSFVASIAGESRAPRPEAVPLRVGGFGGADGFRDFLAQHGVTAVIDATHPYATRITDRSAAICAALGLPYLQVLRAPWVAGDGDDWTEIAREEDAAALIPQGAVVFLGTGSKTLHRFVGLEGCRVICRQIDPPTAPFPFEGGEFLIGRPPFPVAREVSLFSQLGIEWIIVKNAGGDASATKLDAARRLGIPVLMIARPERPDVPCVATAEQAVAWVRAL